MKDDGIDVVLRLTCDRTRGVTAVARDVLAETRETAALLDDVEARTRRLAGRLGVSPHLGSTSPLRATRAPIGSSNWDELVERARHDLGDAPTDASIDDLIDSDRVAEIERLHGTVELRTHLDRLDVMAAVAAATVGTLIDCLVVRIPTGGMWNGAWRRGSELTFRLRRSAVRSDNWISDLAKVPFDRVAHVPIDGFGPRSHRVQTFGHDPLLGLVLGTVDILRGTLTGADPAGVVHVFDSAMPTNNVVAALSRQVVHLLSDVVTPMGLPLPGWTALMAMPIETPVGEVPEIARWMYLRGYGTWHFLSMATVPAAIETLVRSYVGVRRLGDAAFDATWQRESARAGSESVADHPRYRSISLLAHGIAAAGNAGKLIAFGGNPLAVNAAQWTTFGTRLLGSLQTHSASPSIGNLSESNRIAIDTGWTRLTADLVPRP